MIATIIQSEGSDLGGGVATRVLVAGATGQLGRHVVRELKTQGYWVRALVRGPDRVGELGTLVDHVFLADAARPASLGRLCDGIDVVFSSLGAPVVMAHRPPEQSYRAVDYRCNRNLLEAATKASVRRFVYVSRWRCWRQEGFSS